MEIDLSRLTSEMTSSIVRLLGRNAETSRQAMEAVRRSLDTACRSLEQTGAQDGHGEEVQKLIEQLTRAVADHFQSGIEGLQQEADIRIKAAIAETRRQRHEVAALSSQLEEARAEIQALQDDREADGGQGTVATAEAEQLRAQVAELSDRLNEVSTEAGRLRIELETERKQAASMVLEIGQARLTAQRAEQARGEMAAEVAAIHQRLQTTAAARPGNAAAARDPATRPS